MSTGKWSTWWCSLKRRMSFLAVCQPIAKWCTNSSVVTFSCRCVPKKPIKLSMKSSSTNWLAAGLKRLWIFSPPSHFNHASAFSFIVLKVLFLLFNFFLFFKTGIRKTIQLIILLSPCSSLGIHDSLFFFYIWKRKISSALWLASCWEWTDIWSINNVTPWCDVPFYSLVTLNSRSF